MEQPLIITACTNRKSAALEERLQASDLPLGSLKEVAGIWNARVKQHHFRLPASELYVGRGAAEAKKATEFCDGQQWFISAGLGLISAMEEVAAYDLTVAGTGPNCLASKIRTPVFRSKDWWSAVSRKRRPARKLSRLIEANPKSLIILGLPSSYLAMVSDDLEELSSAGRRRLRVIGPPEAKVPAALHPYWMPYDERLDGPRSSYRGTRSDFPQRATRHFLEEIWARSKSAGPESHANSVVKLLADLPYPTIPKRQQLDDSELLVVIKKLWGRAEGQSSRMLRILRDEELIACEQGRFKVLFYRAKNQLGIV